MRGYEKGTTVAGEIEQIELAVVRAMAAVRASATPAEAFGQLAVLADALRMRADQVAEARAWLASSMYDSGQVSSLSQLAAELGISKSRADQLVRAGRRKGNPVTDPGRDPLPLPIALAIIIHDGKILVEHRIDGIPPWTFPAAEIRPGESPAAAIERRVPVETGLMVDASTVIGSRLHPRTGIHCTYMTAVLRLPEAPSPIVPANDDHDEVRWVTPDELAGAMPDMYQPVREIVSLL